MTETVTVTASDVGAMPPAVLGAERLRGRARRPEPTRTLEVGEEVIAPRGLVGKVLERRGPYDYLVEVPDKRDGEKIQVRYDIRSLSRPGEPRRPEREVARAAARAAAERLKERREPTPEFKVGDGVSLLIRGRSVKGTVAEIRDEAYRVVYSSPRDGEASRSEWHGARAVSPA